MIYKVEINEKNSRPASNRWTDFYVRAKDITDAVSKAMKRAEKEYKGIPLRVSKVEETDIDI